jgi:hypothetical protein
MNNPLSFVDPYGLYGMHPCGGGGRCNNGDTDNPLGPSGNGSIWSVTTNRVLFYESSTTYATFLDGSTVCGLRPS